MHNFAAPIINIGDTNMERKDYDKKETEVERKMRIKQDHDDGLYKFPEE